MKEYIESLVLSMNDSCRKCGKFPFCNIEPKEDCREYKNRNYETKLVKVDGLNYKFERIEQ